MLSWQKFHLSNAVFCFESSMKTSCFFYLTWYHKENDWVLTACFIVAIKCVFFGEHAQALRIKSNKQK